MTIRLWNVQTGRMVGNPLKGHTDTVRSVALLPNGHEIASSSDDGTICIWDIRVRTDLESYKEDESDYSVLNEEELRIRWNASCARIDEKDGWVRDGQKLLLRVPLQYQHDINGGIRLVIDAQERDKVRPKVDFQKMFELRGHAGEESIRLVARCASMTSTGLKVSMCPGMYRCTDLASILDAQSGC